MDPDLRPEDWQRHSAALRRVARRLLGKGDADADDLVQGALLTAVERPPRRLTRGWLARVLRHRVFDLGRRRQRERQVQGSLPDPAPDTADVAARLEIYEAVAAAVRELDEPYRRMVWLRWFEDLPPAEIARRLGVPVKTVKTRLHRALGLLRGRLQGRYGRDWKTALAPLIGIQALSAALPAGAVAGGIGLMAKRIAAVIFLALGVWGAWILGSAMLASPDVEPGGVTADAGTQAESGVPVADSAAGKEAETGDEESASPAPIRELARTPPPEDATTGGLRVRVTWYDGTPAADVAIGIRTPWTGTGIPARTLDRVVSDEHGIARATGLPAGEVNLRADRGTDVDAQIEAGGMTEVELQLEAGVQVEGVVVYGDGAPVAGADVWLTAHQPGWLGGRVVARSAVDGTFSMRDVPREQSLGATAAGFSPSALVDLELLDTEESPVSVRLQLTDPGGALAGTVATHLGEPARGARVAVGNPDSVLHSRIGSTIAERWAPRAMTCDEEGRFRFESMAPGEHRVEVLADGHAIWHGEVTITAGETTELPIELPAPVRLAGVVRDAAGRPVAGASVRAFPVALEQTTFLQGGQFDYDSILGYPVTVTDAEGRYRLDDVAPGEIHAYAMEPREPGGFRTYVRDEVVLEASPGDVLTWDPLLAPGHTIEGVVLHRDGEPMGRLFITAKDETTGKREVLHTDEDGRFRFANLENHPYSVSVQVWDPPKDAPPVGRTGVWPDQGELVLRASWDKPVEQVPGTVTGSVHDAAGRLEGAPGVILRSAKNWWRTHPKIDEGAFTFDDVEPGRYKVVVLNGEDPVHTTDWFEVGPGEDKALGVLVTVMPGSLTLRIERGEGAEDEEPTFYLRSGDSIHSTKVQPGVAKVHRVDNLTPGDYQVRGYGSGVASVNLPATVREGDDTEVEVHLRAAVLRGLEIAYPSRPPVASFDVKVLDESGETYYEQTKKWSAALGNPWTLRVRMPLGKYTVRVTTDTGWSGEAAFSMEGLEEDQPPVRIDLK